MRSIEEIIEAAEAHCALGPHLVERLRAERRELASRIARLDGALERMTYPRSMPGRGTVVRQIVDYVTAEPGMTAREISVGMVGHYNVGIASQIAHLVTHRKVLRRERLEGSHIWRYWPAAVST